MLFLGCQAVWLLRVSGFTRCPAHLWLCLPDCRLPMVCRREETSCLFPEAAALVSGLRCGEDTSKRLSPSSSPPCLVLPSTWSSVLTAHSDLSVCWEAEVHGETHAQPGQPLASQAPLDGRVPGGTEACRAGPGFGRRRCCLQGDTAMGRPLPGPQRPGGLLGVMEPVLFFLGRIRS